MSTGKDYGLPEEYHEWEEWTEHPVHFSPVGRDTPALHAAFTVFDKIGKPVYGVNRYFVPPAPKLPEPQPVGTVIGYTTPAGYKRRAIRNPRGWDVYGPEGNILCNVSEAGMHRELQHATDYTVLVGGFDRDAGEVLRNHVNAVSADLMTAIRKQGGIAL